jgi:serine/threonine protein phosphatase PrpC
MLREDNPKEYIRNEFINPGEYWRIRCVDMDQYANRTGIIIGDKNINNQLAKNLETGDIEFEKFKINYAAAAARGYKRRSPKNNKAEKNINCDMIAIAEVTNAAIFAVLDGVGNTEATRRHTNNLAQAIIDPNFDLEAQTENDLDQNRLELNTGACISMVQITKNLLLEETHAGDTKTLVLRYNTSKKTYEIQFYSDLDNVAYKAFNGGKITVQQYNNHRERNYITNFIRAGDIGCEEPQREGLLESESESAYGGLELEDNDIVLMFSDGIDNNFTEEEILKIVNKHQAQGPEAILRAISEAQYNRVTFKATKEKRNDGYKKRAKPDNVSAICLRIEGKEKVAQKDLTK